MMSGLSGGGGADGSGGVCLGGHGCGMGGCSSVVSFSRYSFLIA